MPRCQRHKRSHHVSDPRERCTCTAAPLRRLHGNWSQPSNFTPCHMGVRIPCSIFLLDLDTWDHIDRFQWFHVHRHDTPVASSDMLAPSSVLVVGGGGAVGRHVARSWTSIREGEASATQVRVAGRHADGVRLEGVDTIVLDLERNNAMEKLVQAAQGVDVVVHLAGPFLPDRRSKTIDKQDLDATSRDTASIAAGGFHGRLKVLEAALEVGAHYVDACPHRLWYEIVKESYQTQAETAGVGVVTGASISPGLEELLCKHAYTKGAQSTKVATTMPGNGGLGTAYLADCIAATLLEEQQGAADDIRPGEVVADFGDGVGRKSLRAVARNVYRGGKFPPLELFLKQASSQVQMEPDFESCVGKAASGKALASTADIISGKGYAVRVDSMFGQDNSESSIKKSVSRIFHKNASRLAADVVVAYATMLSNHKIQAGTWFSSEAVADEYVLDVLRMATKSARACDLLVSPWRIATTPKEIGLGIYIE